MNAAYLEPITEFPGEEEVILPPYTIVFCEEVDPARIIDGTAYAYARFRVSKDSKKDEKYFQPFANLFVSTNYYYFLRQSQLEGEPDVQAVINAVTPYTTERTRATALDWIASRGSHPDGISAASQLACYLFSTVERPGDIVGSFFRQVREVLRTDGVEQRCLIPWTKAMLNYIERVPVMTCTVFKLVRRSAIGHMSVGEGTFMLSGDFWNAFVNVGQAAHFAMQAASSGNPFEGVIVAKVQEGCPWAANIQSCCSFASELQFVVAPYALVICTHMSDGKEFGMEGVSFAAYVELTHFKDPGAHILHGLQVVEG